MYFFELSLNSCEVSRLEWWHVLRFQKTSVYSLLDIPKETPWSLRCHSWYLWWLSVALWLNADADNSTETCRHLHFTQPRAWLSAHTRTSTTTHVFLSLFFQRNCGFSKRLQKKLSQMTHCCFLGLHYHDLGSELVVLTSLWNSSVNI